MEGPLLGGRRSRTSHRQPRKQRFHRGFTMASRAGKTKCQSGQMAVPVRGVADEPVAGQDVSVLGLEMVVVLGVALVTCGALARRYPIAPAILLVLVGVLIGFVPHLRQAQLPPGVVLLLFLP